jgi:8-oxo-dGTP pyrophosphatase MutT (NUDIX family)
MRHVNRYDLPKGHVVAGESELECALRELEEETSITQGQIRIEPDFRFETHYTLIDRRYGKVPVNKTVVIFLAWLEQRTTIRPTEHIGYEWQPWRPPHKFNQGTIDGALRMTEDFFKLA